MRGWYGLKKLCRIGMLLLCLMTCSACSMPEMQIVRLTPPETLTTAVAIPEWEGRTNGDLLRWAIKLRQACDRANVQLAAIRSWKNGRDENR